jgi:hypothetical protein
MLTLAADQPQSGTTDDPDLAAALQDASMGGRQSRRGQELPSGLNGGLPRWSEAGECRQTGRIQLGGNMMNQPQRPGAHPPPALNQSGGPSRIPEPNLAEKADTAMYEDDEDRMDAAGQLPELDPRAAAEAFRAIACDGSADDGLRFSAAEQLARLNPRALHVTDTSGIVL